jgi:hypothetical protein
VRARLSRSESCATRARGPDLATSARLTHRDPASFESAIVAPFAVATIVALVARHLHAPSTAPW